jgi:hypothetical protein
VVKDPGYRSRGPEFDSRLYPSFWEVVRSGTGATQPRWVQLRSYLDEKVEAPA